MVGVQKVSNTSAFQQSENRINVCACTQLQHTRTVEWAFKGMAMWFRLCLCSSVCTITRGTIQSIHFSWTMFCECVCVRDSMRVGRLSHSIKIKTSKLLQKVKSGCSSQCRLAGWLLDWLAIHCIIVDSSSIYFLISLAFSLCPSVNSHDCLSPSFELKVTKHFSPTPICQK